MASIHCSRSPRRGWFTLAVPLALSLLSGCDVELKAVSVGTDEKSRLSALVLPDQLKLPADPTNRYADDPAAAVLGQKLFFDTRFSGPLLDTANNGEVGTLGQQNESGRVSCAGCHVASDGTFVDTRTARGQLSLGAGWTRRRTPTLLDVAQAPLLGWDGRRSTSFAVVFAVVESPLEFNSSRLFVAQQIARHYRDEYEAVFGPLPSLAAFEVLEAGAAGCTRLPSDPLNVGCPKPGQDDVEVTRVVVNMGKALQAYMRKLTCGPSRFDAWMKGDLNALSVDEIAGAKLFVGKGRCDTCHSGPYFTDQRFHNVGARGGLVPFTGVDNSNDLGAEAGLAAARDDWLNSDGPFSDGNDHRVDDLPEDLSELEGAFRTPGLRCLDHRPSFMHGGLMRTLYDVVDLFRKGGDSSGFAGTSELTPIDITDDERDQLVAFMLSLQGPGPLAELRTAPALP